MAFTSNVLDSIGDLHTVVGIVMAEMPEFPKIETIQIWGCAVLQQAFPTYIQLAQCMFQCSNDKENGILDVGHDSNNAFYNLKFVTYLRMTRRQSHLCWVSQLLIILVSFSRKAAEKYPLNSVLLEKKA